MEESTLYMLSFIRIMWHFTEAHTNLKETACFEMLPWISTKMKGPSNMPTRASIQCHFSVMCNSSTHMQ